MIKNFRLILASEEIDESFEYYSELVEYLADKKYIDINDPLLFVVNQYEKGRWAECNRTSLEQEIESVRFERLQEQASESRHNRYLGSVYATGRA